DDRMAPYQPRERGACGSPSGEHVSPRAGGDQSLWSRGDPFDRASEQGLGDPRHRHRSRRAPALSLRQAGPHAGAGVRRSYGATVIRYFRSPPIALYRAITSLGVAAVRASKAKIASPSIGLMSMPSFSASSTKALSRRIAMNAVCSALARSGGTSGGAANGSAMKNGS